MMQQIRNRAGYDLEVAGRVYPAGEAVEVGAGEAAYLASNPNFEPVDELDDRGSSDDPPADDAGTDKPRRGGRKATR